ncbi:MAG: tetratricopeptide repeat protein [Anaerolineae bacterium]|jgi:tetratricopeptide (TPR) repeat protein
MIRRTWNWLLSRFYRRLADAHRHFGNLYSSRQEYLAAIEGYTRAITLDSAYTDVYHSRGVLYWREFGHHDRAIRDLNRVLELDPSRAEAYFNRAFAYKLQGEHDKAIADFERYLETGQDDFWLDAAHRQLAELHDEGSGENGP